MSSLFIDYRRLRWMETRHRGRSIAREITLRPRIGHCTYHVMPIQYEEYDCDRVDTGLTGMTAGRAAVLLAAGIGVFLAARWLRGSRGPTDEFGLSLTEEQAVTVKAPLEAAEAAWIEWCVAGHSKLKNDYAIRFEPAPGARGTEVHLSGGGSRSTTREELRQFKQLLETGQIVVSDGPGLWKPAQPSGDRAGQRSAAEVLE